MSILFISYSLSILPDPPLFPDNQAGIKQKVVSLHSESDSGSRIVRLCIFTLGKHLNYYSFMTCPTTPQKPVDLRSVVNRDALMMDIVIGIVRSTNFSLYL